MGTESNLDGWGGLRGPSAYSRTIDPNLGLCFYLPCIASSARPPVSDPEFPGALPRKSLQHPHIVAYLGWLDRRAPQLCCCSFARLSCSAYATLPPLSVQSLYLSCLFVCHSLCLSRSISISVCCVLKSVRQVDCSCSLERQGAPINL